jgi:hypothetical protein
MPSLGRIHNCRASQMPIAAAITINCVASSTVLLLRGSTRHGASAPTTFGRAAAAASIQQVPDPASDRHASLRRRGGPLNYTD